MQMFKEMLSFGVFDQIKWFYNNKIIISQLLTKLSKYLLQYVANIKNEVLFKKIENPL
jgi:hypothetical protein